MDAFGMLILLLGCALCLLAAIGVLRLPDFFMRMHAATKAGVVGSGLVLLGLALIDGTAATAVKVVLVVLFLLLTTPVAGHLLGRAAYVAGTPLWRGTASDALAGVLERHRFDEDEGPASVETVHSGHAGDGPIRTVVVALLAGPRTDAAIDRALDLAIRHGAELLGIAAIDAPRLANVGPVPIGAGWHAQQMRERRLRLARDAAAGVVQQFEARAAASGVRWSVRVEEGRPRKIFAATDQPGTWLVVPGEGWFDHGVIGIRADPARRLRLGRRDGPVVRQD
ncbi:MAG: monovalent cation/H(+) antiporter subunit G [Lautropia sp.]